MKKIFFLIIAVAGLGLSACHHRCETCDCPRDVRYDICRDDYVTRQDYDRAIRNAEINEGCRCIISSL